jgi:glycosyltransferase involved in cell wall biosynthesis
MKVLYITHDGLTDPLGQSQVLPYLTNLAKLGHSIVVLSCEKPEKFAKLGDEIRSICTIASIEWRPIEYANTPPLIGTLKNIRQMKSQARDLCRNYNIDIVHCRSYIASLVGLPMKREFAVKFIFDMRGFWADERIEGGIWSRENIVYKFAYSYFKKKEHEFIRNADHIVSLTKAAKKIIEDWKITDAPITVIPTCTDLQLFNVKSVNDDQRISIRKDLGLREDDFVMLYHGSWGTWYMKEEMCDFFSALKKNKPFAKWVIATQDLVHLDNYPHKSDVIVFNCPRRQIPALISVSSLCLFFIRPSFSKMASMPTKLGELVAMEARMVTNKGFGDIENILAGYSRAYMVNDFTDAEYQKAINNDVDLKNAKVSNELTEYFSLENGVNTYNSIYHSFGIDR